MKPWILLKAGLLTVALLPAQEPPRLLSSRTQPLGQRQITFEKLQPLTLPASPPTSPSLPSALNAPPASPLKPQRFLFLGGTIYLPQGNPLKAKALVHYAPQPGTDPVLLWINAQLAWLGGFAEIDDPSATHALLIATSEVALPAGNPPDPTPASPPLPPGISWPTFAADNTGEIQRADDSTEPLDLSPLQALMATYRAQWPTLRTAHQQRLAAAQRQKIRELADPPHLKNLRVRYWQTLPATSPNSPQTPSPSLR
ncbi:hypothetical protein HNR46_001197 [Haloferula luteola]|uniref:Uncharacterized protein n=1 Tax=Haloferula luteola TaxID=595692 RepID=A0A840V0U1_9BACT|nr:hypothetical protein [Haloferula luteola]MBB5350963.1 hypothetical protein [Haloferula luteola]